MSKEKTFEELFPVFTSLRTNTYSLPGCEICQKKFTHDGKGRDSRVIRIRLGGGRGDTDFIMACTGCAKNYKENM